MKKFKQWIFERWYRQEAGRLELLGWLEGVTVVQKIFQAVITDAERMLALPNFSKRDREKGLALIQKVRQDVAGAVVQVVKTTTSLEIPRPSGRKVINSPLPIMIKPRVVSVETAVPAGEEEKT